MRTQLFKLNCSSRRLDLEGLPKPLIRLIRGFRKVSAEHLLETLSAQKVLDNLMQATAGPRRPSETSDSLNQGFPEGVLRTPRGNP